jgi:hypothetical protein
MLPRACAVIAAVAVLAPSSPASAETWTARDARGDVDGYTYTSSPVPDACPTFTDLDGSDDTNDDITRLTVRHDRTTIEVEVWFRDLHPKLEQSLNLRLKTVAGTWSLSVDRSHGDRPRKFRTWTNLSREPGPPDPADVDPDGDGCSSWSVVSVVKNCNGLQGTVDLDRDVITVSLPRTCLRSPRWVRVGAGSSGYEYPATPSDQASPYTFNGYNDSWDPEGTTSTDGLPPLGPRLRVRDGVVS